MVINKDGHSGIVFQSTKSHELIGAIVVGIHRESFARLQHKYPGLNRRNGVQVASKPIVDPEDKRQIIFLQDFLRNAALKKSIVDRESVKLLNDAGIDPNLPTYGSEHFETIQSVLDRWEMRLVYFEREKARAGSMLEWAGKVAHDSLICIAHYRGTYSLLQTAHSLLKRKFCNKCLKFEAKNRHRCRYSCRLCGSQDLDQCENPSSRVTIVCAECNVHFTSRSCYDRHLTGSTNGLGRRCDKIKCCTKCGRTWNKDYTPQHDCRRGNWVVRRPGKMCSWQEVTDKQKKKAKQRQSFWKLASWDVETVQALPGDTFADHYVNLLVLRWTCYACYEKPDFHKCENCGTTREEIFKWEKPGNDQAQIIRRFLRFMLTDQRMHDRVVVSHNGAKYDHHFLVEELTAIGVRTRYIIDSTAIITIETDDTRSVYNSLKFKDSYKLITCALSDFTKTLGLDCSGKGIFPYKMNNPRFYGHKQRGLPPEYFYGVMNEKKRKEFEEYKAQVAADPNFIFDFDKALVEYCRQDVKVLLAGVIKFDRLLTDLSGWSPFFNCLTLASYTLFVHRYNYANHEEYIYLPENGISNCHVRQSEIGLKWLLWIEEKLTYRIQHAGRIGGEKRVCAGGKYYFVDGFDERTNTVYDFLGCYQLRENTLARIEALKAEGFNVVVAWECELTRPENPLDEEIINMKKFFSTCDVSAMIKLRPRDVLTGGRCEMWKYLTVAGEGETIYYLDITSLYPSQMFFNSFPVGEPQIRDNFTSEEVSNLPFRGFIKASILPNKELRKPVLPYRCENRLLFPNCGKCAREQNKESCEHTDEERKLVGTWTDIEVKKAVSLGYRVLELYEVWNWPANQWRKDIYSDYIRLFYKVKLCSSGWPKEIEKDDRKKEEYLQWHRDNMGMTIEAHEIQKNNSLRFCSKLILNSLWGKMAQRDSLRTKEILDDEAHAELLLDSSRQTLLSKGINDKYFVVHRPVNEERHSSRFASLAHSSFVCAYGRLKLYSLMERVGESLTYVDTDSLIFKCAKGEANPLADDVTGYLGQLTSEVPEGKRIKSVLCNGPKSYSIRYEDGEEIVKSKGIHQNEATNALSYENLEKIVKSNFDDEGPMAMKLPQSTIARPEIGVIRTRDFEKIVQHNNHKSAVEGTTFETAINRPFGYL